MPPTPLSISSPAAQSPARYRRHPSLPSPICHEVTVTMVPRVAALLSPCCTAASPPLPRRLLPSTQTVTVASPSRRRTIP
ncbi:hypothetical protein M0R45_001779 [Rubus argutus]|uniref:Uncharacterized protein n=1 Tax=Rubus argutus TaxID=59490 RepID=A0AAW1VK23_RUBAR